MQNRESAVRSRNKKKENVKIIEAEMEIIKKENYRLFYENKNLINEKNFLIEQIKFMQNLIRSNNTPLKINIDNDSNCDSRSVDLEKNITTKSVSASSNNIVLNGGKQRPIGKLFSIFIVCMLGVFYINPAEETGQKINLSANANTLSLNDDSDRISQMNANSFFIDNFNFNFMRIFKFALMFLILTIIWYAPIDNVYIKIKRFIKRGVTKINKNL